MWTVRKRRGAVFLLIAGAAALVPLAMASACTGGAFLMLDPPSVRSGQVTTLNGKGGFDPTPGASPVEVRVGGLSGELVWSGRPDAMGNFTAEVTAPPLAPGHHLVVATQTDASGHLVRWCPCRAQLEVVGADGQPAGSPSVASGPDGVPTPATSSEWLVVGLLAAGMAIVVAAGGILIASLGPVRSRARARVGS